MMYKLKHFLFGWDYIQWNNSADQGVARVFELPDGKVVFWQYWTISLLFEITDKSQVNWLTCKPSK